MDKLNYIYNIKIKFYLNIRNEENYQKKKHILAMKQIELKHDDKRNINNDFKFIRFFFF